MSSSWQILVVDDEPAIHKVTELCLRRKTWKGQPFEVHSAFSADEGRKFLESPEGRSVRVALVDVVMETDSAGLDLCNYIRSALPPTLRIVLRTGQPGSAPEMEVLETYDIDYYLHKTDATAERLYSVLRACLLSSVALEAQAAAG